MTISNICLLHATIFVGLMAGLFYSYSFSVSLGLKKLGDGEYLLAMQSINREIQNPVFFISFIGALILLPVTTCVKYSHPVSSNFWLILCACCIYLIGASGVTALGNIPLNNALDKFNVADSTKDLISAQRKLFEAKWNNLNMIRTISSILSFILLTIACLNNVVMNGTTVDS